MRMTDNGGDRGIAPPKPLFESSWLALFFLLKQELESLREEGAGDDVQGKGKKPRTETPERTN